ncbi:MAG: Do family serine endopeptidase [Bryobacterales bacterium]|nr:Do family serine endopeptidase [Bryobacterales bacterium]
MRKQRFLSITLMVFVLSIGIVIGTLVDTGVKAGKGQAAPDATPLEIPSPVQLSSAFSQLAKKLEPSVVHISTIYEPKAQERAGRSGQEEDLEDLFNRFFGMPGPREGAPGRQRRGSALGSGVIIDPNGYILTNNHVVEKADRIQVALYEGKTKYDAKLIGADPESDLAVIKIDAGTKLPAARIGNSDAIQVGDWCVAIGSPFGLQATVTAGIISAKDRGIGPSNLFQRFLQTDAAINPGNSGGPLVNINGEVIGINTAIASGTGGFQGVGFALPINTAAKVYNQIIKTGKMTRGAIGVSFRDSKPELLEVYGAKEGVFVEGVTPGMPADKAGIRPEDIITAIDGEAVKDGQELVNRISDTPIGTEVDVTLIRDKKPMNVKVRIGDRTEIVDRDRGARPSTEPEERGEARPAKFGITIEMLTGSRREAIGLDESGGVIVVNVEGGSFGDDIGLLPNDVILSINRQDVNSLDDVKRIQDGLKAGDPVALRVKRATGPLPPRAPRAPEWVNIFLAGTLPDTSR